MKITDFLIDDVVVIELSGKMLGGEPTTMLRGRIQEYLTLGKSKIVLDLAGIDRINSVGLGVLNAANRTVGQYGGKMVLANITNIESLLTMTRLIHFLPHTDSCLDAVKQLRYN